MFQGEEPIEGDQGVSLRGLSRPLSVPLIHPAQQPSPGRPIEKRADRPRSVRSDLALTGKLEGEIALTRPRPIFHHPADPAHQRPRALRIDQEPDQTSREVEKAGLGDPRSHGFDTPMLGASQPPPRHAGLAGSFGCLPEAQQPELLAEVGCVGRCLDATEAEKLLSRQFEGLPLTFAD